MILLDTCTLLWFAKEDEKLSSKALEKISIITEHLFVSDISAIEINRKEQKGLISLPINIKQWWPQFLAFYNIKAIPVDSNIAIASTQLPLLHKDPADRIIIATAIHHKLKILTPDKHIKAYKEVKTIW